MRVWIVQGRWGDYSDRTEWPVAWFPTKELAEAHRDLLQADVNAISSDDWCDLRFEDEKAFRAKLPRDPQAANHYGAATYSVYWLDEGPEGGSGA